jgi:hypothetical protein
MLDMLELINAKLIEENDSVLIVVYAVNQKGRSLPVIIRDLELGAVVKLDRGMNMISNHENSTQTSICTSEIKLYDLQL